MENVASPSFSKWTVGRLARAVTRRLARRTESIIFRAEALAADLSPPAGMSLVRITANDADRDIATAPMAEAGEDTSGLRWRFDHGDEFFGWRAGDGAIASF